MEKQVYKKQTQSESPETAGEIKAADSMPNEEHKTDTKSLKKTVLTVAFENKLKIASVSVFFAIIVCVCAYISLFTNIVRVSDTDAETIVVTTAQKPQTIFELFGISVSDTDTILTTKFTGAQKNIKINRDYNVDITVDGGTVQSHIVQGTVAQCIANSGIELGENDFTVPSLNTVLSDGDTIRVYRVVYVDNQYEETVPYSTKYKSSSLIYRFKKSSYVIQAGSNGTNLVTYRERYVDGELVLALVSNVEVVKKPVDEIVLSYSHTAVSPLEAPAGVTVNNYVPTGYSYVLSNVAATGYYSATGKGSSGLGLFYGSCAVNPNIIPYGSKMYIVSPDGEFIYGWAIATDTGTAVMEGIIGVDLFYETYKESALNWKNVVNIYVYPPS